MAFLPVTLEECRERGFEKPDFVLITGDGYVDHPSFGTAIIGRVLESHGYKVAVLSQPDWHSTEDFCRFGRPRLGFLINSGNVDSMVNHYSVFKRRRKTDDYSPGGQAGKRPDRAVIVYSNRAREAYKDCPIIIGGIEASLRRLAHYDYWEDRLRRSILLDAKADLLIYGMGERTVVEVAEALDSGIDIKDISWIRGTCYKRTGWDPDEYSERLPDFQSLLEEEKIPGLKPLYAESFAIQYRNMDSVQGKTLAEEYQNNLFVVQNPPQPPLEQLELDRVYQLPYEGTYHPSYEEMGGVPAIREVQFSLVSNRGCFGGCSFCAITYHQGREVRSKSKEVIMEEAKALIRHPDFKGYIHDVGGPTANFRQPACRKQLESGVCRNKDCMTPQICSQMEVDHTEYLDILRSLRNLEGVKKVFIRSGIRYDYVLADSSDEFLWELCRHHVSGTLKVAPEHVSNRVLRLMRKPEKEVFEEFSRRYEEVNKRLGKKQYLIPYLISSHPGSRVEEGVELALYLRKMGFVPDQVQDFYPTPGTLSTCMYYTGLDPLTGEKVYVARSQEEKQLQRALLHFNKPESRQTAIRLLKKMKREDLIHELTEKTSGNPGKKQKGI